MKRTGQTLDMQDDFAGVAELPLDARAFDDIRRLARSAFGLDLKPGKEELVSARLRRLVRDGGFGSFHEYCRGVAEDRTGASLAAMIDALATNHTSFLREPEHFDFLRRELAPALAHRPLVEVWSAACATGEEVWTLACVLDEALGSRPTRIIGTDISTRALRAASDAVYSADRCGDLPEAWRGRYFAAEGRPSAWRVVPRIRQRARFARLNLTVPYARAVAFPVIFCRNVMIYFDRETQDKVVKQLAACLEPGGYLFVGHAESLVRNAHGLEYVRPAVYRKSGAATI